MADVLVRTRALRKEFSGVPVLRDVDAEIRSGEILALIGENGAGKSTFMKILSGIYRPSSGTLDFDGKRVFFRSPAEAKAAGVSIVPQEFNLAADLTVAENVFLGTELRGRFGLPDGEGMRRRTAELLEELGAAVSPDEKIENLSAAQKQLVEVCKALAFEAKLLILDEPTTVLTKVEIDRLFGLMRKLRSRGMTMVYVSHKLAEVKAVCDRVLVLKDGELVHESAVVDIEPPEMARRMVGRELKDIYPPKRPVDRDAGILLEARGLSSAKAFYDLSFNLREGEILGFAGLVGAGRTETAEALMGLRKASGAVELRGKPALARDAAEAVGLGFAYLSEDRQGSGILTGFGVAENVTLVSLSRYSGFLGTIDRTKELAAAAAWRSRFGVKASSLDERLEFLSGGNQQKVSLAKALDADPAVVIADEPTRGVDVAAKQEIYRYLVELAAKGTGILLISSELEEIVGLCSRVVVMRGGRIAGELEGEDVKENEIMYLATGIREGESA